MESHRRPSTYSGCKGGPSQLCPQVVSQGHMRGCMPPAHFICLHARNTCRQGSNPSIRRAMYVQLLPPPQHAHMPLRRHPAACRPVCQGGPCVRRASIGPSIQIQPSTFNGLPLSLSLFAILRGPSLPSSFVQAGPLLPDSLSLFNPSPYEDRPELRTRNSSRSSFPACPPLNPPRLH